MRITPSLIAELQAAYTPEARRGFGNNGTRAAAVLVHLKTIMSDQMARLVAKGEVTRLVYECCQCRKAYFGSFPYCSPRCVKTKALSVAEEANWSLLKTEKTQQSFRFHVRCNQCSHTRSFATDWLHLGNSCLCQRNKKIGDSQRIPHAFYVVSLRKKTTTHKGY